VENVKEERPDDATASSSGWLVAHRDIIVRIAMISVVLAMIVLGLVMWTTGRLDFETLGYPAIWISNFIGSASVFIPVPGLAAVCWGADPEWELNLVAIGVIAGSAQALGELSGYIAGLSGKGLVTRSRFYPRVERWMRRHGTLFLFCMAVIPNPAFDVAGMAAGSTGYPVRKFLAVLFVAKSLRSIGIAYGCAAGIEWLRQLV
jgi:membrane protein YqaA with SNARE-associated domain